MTTEQALLFGLIACMLALGEAMMRTGTAAFLAQQVAAVTSGVVRVGLPRRNLEAITGGARRDVLFAGVSVSVR